MTGLIRYRAALLVRSYRWVPAVLVFGLGLVSATAGGPPPADAFGFGGGMLVLVTAWLTRLVATGEPAAAQACAGAAGGTGRAQLAGLVVAAGAGVILAVLSAPVLLLVGVRQSSALHPLPGAGPVAVSGLLGELACVLVGVAIGAVSNPPVLRIRAAGVLATGLLVVIALVARMSPAVAAIRVVLVGSSGNQVRYPLLELAAAGLLLAVAATGSALVARSRGVD
ncbi:MAG TPA: hypothetical protein VFP72_10845 [Kineosporiaceae bacterium]|nr:hypothetical protein [Kineosporiaceae bacterium]